MSTLISYPVSPSCIVEASFAPYGLRMHVGTDYTPAGSSEAQRAVYALTAGIVSSVGDKHVHQWYKGNTIVINHGILDHMATTAYYGNIGRTCVSEGQKVEVGELIGYMDSKASEQGCRGLHLALRLNGYEFVDAHEWLIKHKAKHLQKEETVIANNLPAKKPRARRSQGTQKSNDGK